MKVALRDVRHEYSQFPALTVPSWPYLFTAALADRERRAGFSILQRQRLSREWICSRFKVPPKVRIRTGLNSGFQALIFPLPTHAPPASFTGPISAWHSSSSTLICELMCMAACCEEEPGGAAHSFCC